MFATNSRYRFGTGFVFALLTVCIPGLAGAQDELADDMKAVVAFDFQFDKIRDSKPLKGGNWEFFVRNAQLPNSFLFPTSYADRIYGAVGPTTRSEKKEETDEFIPYEFFVRIQYHDATVLQEIWDIYLNEMKVEEIDGKNHLRMPDGPPNLSLSLVNQTTMEIGTDLYVKQKTRSVQNKKLTELWPTLPDSAIRIAVDVQGAREFFDSPPVDPNVSRSGQYGVRIPGPLLIFQCLSPVLMKATTAQITLNADSEPLLQLELNTAGNEDANHLHGAMNGVIGTLRFSEITKLRRIENPLLARVVTSFRSNLKAEREGSVVSIRIPRPQGFDQLLSSMSGSDQSQSFRDCGESILNYHDTFKRLPIDRNETHSKNLSWRVFVLPFMGEVPLYNDLAKIKEDWDSESNKKLVDKMPAKFGFDKRNAKVCWILSDKSPRTLSDITDGASNTIMLLENPNGVPWTQPIDLSFDDAITLISKLREGQSLFAVLYDGSVIKVPHDIDPNLLRRLLDPYDGEKVKIPDSMLID